MGRRPQQDSWSDAKRRCRLNRNDLEMARRLGFTPGSLIQNIPGPRQKWKLPVKACIRDLYFQRFGHVLGEKPLPSSQPVAEEWDQNAARQFEEQLYWEDYHERNQ